MSNVKSTMTRVYRHTDDQLAEMAALFGVTKVALLAIAVDRLYKDKLDPLQMRPLREELNDLVG